MKDVTVWQTRSIAVLENNALVLRICNLAHGIDVLETVLSLIDQVQSAPSQEVLISYDQDPARRFCDLPDYEIACQEVMVTFVGKRNPHHQDVYLIKVRPSLRTGTTVIFNEKDLPHVKVRLRDAIARLKEEWAEYMTKKKILEKLK